MQFFETKHLRTGGRPCFRAVAKFEFGRVTFLRGRAMVTRAEARRIDRLLERLETELSELRFSRAALASDLIESREQRIADVEAEIAAANARIKRRN